MFFERGAFKAKLYVNDQEIKLLMLLLVTRQQSLFFNIYLDM